MIFISVTDVETWPPGWFPLTFPAALIDSGSVGSFLFCCCCYFYFFWGGGCELCCAEFEIDLLHRALDSSKVSSDRMELVLISVVSSFLILFLIWLDFLLLLLLLFYLDIGPLNLAGRFVGVVSVVADKWLRRWRRHRSFGWTKLSGWRWPVGWGGGGLSPARGKRRSGRRNGAPSMNRHWHWQTRSPDGSL